MLIYLSACISVTPTGWISIKFDTGACMNICQENPNVVKLCHNCSALYMKTYVRFVVASDFNPSAWSDKRCSS